MRIRQMTLSLALLVLLLFVVGCDSQRSANTERPIAKKDNLPIGAFVRDAGVGIAVADMNGDGKVDIVAVSPEGVLYFENNGRGAFVDRGRIAASGAFRRDAGVGIAVGDIDSNGIPDLVVASPEGIRILKNPIPHEKNK